MWSSLYAIPFHSCRLGRRRNGVAADERTRTALRISGDSATEDISFVCVPSLAVSGNKFSWGDVNYRAFHGSCESPREKVLDSREYGTGSLRRAFQLQYAAKLTGMVSIFISFARTCGEMPFAGFILRLTE